MGIQINGQTDIISAADGSLSIEGADLTSAINFSVSGVGTITNLRATNANITGVVTSVGGFNIGIQSAGAPITSGVVTAFNFVGAGNTFLYNSSTKTVDISISSPSSTMVVAVRTGTAVTFSIPTTRLLSVSARSGTINVPV